MQPSCYYSHPTSLHGHSCSLGDTAWSSQETLLVTSQNSPEQGPACSALTRWQPPAQLQPYTPWCPARLESSHQPLQNHKLNFPSPAHAGGWGSSWPPGPPWFCQLNTTVNPQSSPCARCSSRLGHTKLWGTPHHGSVSLSGAQGLVAPLWLSLLSAAPITGAVSSELSPHVQHPSSHGEIWEH